ncbi:MAG TPA: hypothetical protein VM867_04460, partial [Xanthobacteraceae bacterium]|nr:hypothetical protein [Xanthobacteraceae bacterium]
MAQRVGIGISLFEESRKSGLFGRYIGSADHVSPAPRVGYLQQEPQLDESKTVRENVMEGVAAKKALLDRYNE